LYSSCDGSCASAREKSNETKASTKHRGNNCEEAGGVRFGIHWEPLSKSVWAEPALHAFGNITSAAPRFRRSLLYALEPSAHSGRHSLMRLRERRGMTGGWIAPRLVAMIAVGLLCGMLLSGTGRAQGPDDLTRLQAEVSRLHGQGKYAEALQFAQRAAELALRHGEEQPEFASPRRC